MAKNKNGGRVKNLPKTNELKVPLPHLVPKKECKRTTNAILIISVALVV